MTLHSDFWKDEAYAWEKANPKPVLDSAGFFPDGSVNIMDPVWDWLDDTDSLNKRMKLREAIP